MRYETAARCQRTRKGLPGRQDPLAIQRRSGERADEAATLGDRGVIRRLRGRHEQSAADLGEALAIAREIGERGLEIQALDGLGVTLEARGDPAAAAGHHREALALARETGDRQERARAHDGLAGALPDPAAVRRRRRRFHRRRPRSHHDRARDAYRDLDVPEAG